MVAVQRVRRLQKLRTNDLNHFVADMKHDAHTADLEGQTVDIVICLFQPEMLTKGGDQKRMGGFYVVLDLSLPHASRLDHLPKV